MNEAYPYCEIIVMKNTQVCSCWLTVGDVVDAVQVALAVLIVHVLAFGCHDLDGIVTEENLAWRPERDGFFLMNAAGATGFRRQLTVEENYRSTRGQWKQKDG